MSNSFGARHHVPEGPGKLLCVFQSTYNSKRLLLCPWLSRRKCFGCEIDRTSDGTFALCLQVTPFQVACEEENYEWNGGKEDDITVVVAKVQILD